MGDKQRLFDAAPDDAWTRPETYIGAMARKRRFRRSKAAGRRTHPERPRLMLSTVPFLALFALLAVLAAMIMIIAFPGSQPLPRQQQAAAKEPGVAAHGWFQEAQKQFHKS